MRVTPLPIITFESKEQPINADSPMEVTLPGIDMLGSEAHPANAEDPIDVTLSGMVTLVRERQ